MITKVLIVDDSSTARLLLKMCLKKLGDFEIFDAGDPKTAKEILINSSPSICVLDYNMPEQVGTELAKSLLEINKDISLILMTANMQAAVVKEAKEVGFSAFIEKPVDADKVSAALDRVL